MNKFRFAILLMAIYFIDLNANLNAAVCDVQIAVDSSFNVTCKGNNNGRIFISVTSSTPGYSFSWSPGGYTTQNITGIGPGTYTVIVTDAVSCVDTESVVITEPSIVVPLVTPAVGGFDLICKGDFSGSAVINTGILEGTAPYSYLWCNGATTSSVSGLPAGCICVHISDANGCTADTTVCLAEPANPLISNLSAMVYPGGHNIACKGESSGYIYTNATGGVPSYSYQWLLPASLPPPNSATDSNLVKVFAGFYQLQITDANGCVVIDTITLTEPDTIVPHIVKVFYANDLNLSCYGSCDGGIKVLSVDGGTPPFTYLWDLVHPGPVYDSLCEGEYLLHITDANGCVLDTAATLSGPSQIQVTSFTSTNITGCYGDSTGYISPDFVYGGNPGFFGYDYSWSPTGETTASISGLFGGTYTLTITDGNACQQPFAVVITQPDSIDVTPTVSNVLCYGIPTGSVSVSASGGTGAYTYLWSPGLQTTSSISGLSIGTYCVHITDANGCFSDRCFTVTQPPELKLDSLVPSVYPGGWNISCNGINNGNVFAYYQGGTGPYSFNWSNGATTQNLFNVTVNTYLDTIRDSNGCIATGSITLSQPQILKDSINSVTDVACFGDSSGVIVVSSSGGTPPYNYYLGNFSNPVSSTITGLPVGAYSIYVVDTNGCVDSSNVVITQPTATLNAAINSTVVSCAGVNTGMANVGVTGGTPPYLYSWSSGAGTDSTATGLAPGTYSVTVTDANGCTQVDFATINLSSFNAAITFQELTCKSSPTGYATVTPTGGSGSYTYLWNNTQTTATATGLDAGTYSVVVTDSLGCDTTLSTTINPNTLLASITATELTCKSSPTGYATVTPTGGSGSYTYLWNNTQTTATATGLDAGTYSVVITDSLGCDTTLFTTINPNTLLASITATELTCKSSPTGYAIVTPTGGSGSYTYLWNNTQTTATATGLDAGTYSVVVTDSLGCDTTLSTTINPNTLLASITATELTCKSSPTGYATVTPTGGSGSYTYLWNNTQTTATATGLDAGTYSVIVTDSLGCDTTLFTSITPNTLLASITATELTCKSAPTGYATVTPTGGSGSYTYLWNNTQTTATATGLDAGTYSVVVTDSLGCDTTLSTTINPNTLLASITATELTCKSSPTGYATVTPTGGSGSYTYLWNNTQTTATATGLDAGTYSVVVTDSLGCDTTLSTTINPNTLLASITATELTCKSSPTGYAIVTPTGGSGSYTYLWNNTQTTATATGLDAGTYSVVVTDSLGCDTTLFATIDQNTLEANISDTHIACQGVDNGTATVTPTGGVAPYTYLWSNSQTNNIATGLSASTYSVIVTDQKGCDTLLVASINRDTMTTTIISPISGSGICGDSTTVIAQPLLPGQTGIWIGNGVFVDPTNPNTLLTGLPYGSDTIVWIVTDTYTKCVVSSAPWIIDAFEPVTAKIDGPADTTLCVQDFSGQYQLVALNPSPGTGAWTVVIGNGSFSNNTILNPIYYATKDTALHLINWIVVNGVCGDTAAIAITISHIGRCLDLELPNGFSPNNDGKNDDYVIVGIERYPVNTFKVFNRWGNEVFVRDNYANHDATKNWAGQNKKGEKLPDGTYYVILVTDNGNVVRNTYVDLRK